MRILFIPLLAVAAGLSTAQQPSVTTTGVPGNLSIPAQLNTTIRADKAHAGDLVRFKTIEPVLVSQGMTIPANAHLYGHVLGAAARQAQTPSWISVVVDRVEWKEHALALHAFISGQVKAPGGPPTGAPETTPGGTMYPPGAPHNPVVGIRRNLGDPRSAIA